MADYVSILSKAIAGLSENTAERREQVYSKARPGEVATFDEALEAYVTEYPHHEHILKGRQLSGSGAPGGTSAKGANTISRAEFEAKQSSDPAGAAKLMREGVQVTD